LNRTCILQNNTDDVRMKHRTISLGSRTSRLAQQQAQLAKDALLTVMPDADIRIMTFQTTGDAYLAGELSDIGNKGLFTKEIELALLRGDIDIAVHSMKDMATKLPDGLMMGAMLPRDDVRCVLLSSQAKTIAELPEGAILGTSSLRRAVHVQYQRPDIQVVSYRGNLDRRIARLEAGEVDASLLAKAGLDRLNIALDYATPLSIEEMLPAVAQGAIGLQCRDDDSATRTLLEGVNCHATMACVEVERMMLAALDGSCRTPIAGYATLNGETLHLRGLLASLDGTKLVRHEMSAPRADASDLALELAQHLRFALAAHG
jgi:hydroxymethylbilane synthase